MVPTPASWMPSASKTLTGGSVVCMVHPMAKVRQGDLHQELGTA